MRWHYRDGGLLWPFVPAYAIHIAEEWFAGFPQWTANVMGRPMPDTAFVVINAIAMVAMLAAIRAAIRDERNGWMAIAIATILLVNTAAHAAGAIMTQAYSPGLISAVIFYVPLGSLTMIRALDQAPRDQAARGVVAGVLVHAVVFIIAYASTRLG
ncbi:MAG TPA: HXXEE domain-containing protein [Vicinamibacterales bacterium]|nr:HXXEE domain-containing protein [Vicinamibacterales bacterium]